MSQLVSESVNADTSSPPSRARAAACRRGCNGRSCNGKGCNRERALELHSGGRNLNEVKCKLFLDEESCGNYKNSADSKL